MPLVRRSNQRFEGVTQEGQRVLDAVRRMLADAATLKQTVGKDRLSGRLRIGIIPTAEATERDAQRAGRFRLERSDTHIASYTGLLNEL